MQVKINTTKQRVIAYIDGYNLYWGMIDNEWRKYLWLDMTSLCEKLMRPYQKLIAVRYHTAISRENLEQRDRQNRFLSANSLNPKFKIDLGQFKKHPNKNYYIEKETDVRIAINMVRDVILNNCDRSLLISADSDLVPALDFMAELNQKHKTIIYYPPKRFSFELQQRAKKDFHLQNFESQIRDSQLPEEISLESGTILKRPNSWQ